MRRERVEKEQGLIVHDRLYGQIVISPIDLQICQTPEMGRLRDISLSAVPSRLTLFGQHANKFEHSLGVAHLASLLPPDFDPYRKLIHYACLLHDIASPPFPHLSEHFMEDLVGQNHEQFIDVALATSRIGEIIEADGVSFEDVKRVVKGELPINGQIVAGSIDIDNLDNTLRYGLSCGVVRAAPYKPEKLIKAFRIVDGQLVLHSSFKEMIEQWDNLRIKVYRLGVYDDANLTGAMMLYRALELAYKRGEIPVWFFTMTDSQALQFLLEKTNPNSARLLADALNWRFYERVYDLDISRDYHNSPKEVTRLCENWQGRSELADIISQELGIQPVDITVYTGISRAIKRINLPFYDKKNGFMEAQKLLRRYYWGGYNDVHYMVKVYINPQLREQSNKIKSLVDEVLGFKKRSTLS